MNSIFSRKIFFLLRSLTWSKSKEGLVGWLVSSAPSATLGAEKREGVYRSSGIRQLAK